MWSVEQWSFRFHSKLLSWFPWWGKTWSSSWFMRRWILIFCPSSINLFKSNFFTELYDWIAHSHKGVRGWGHSDIHTEKELRFERELNPGPPAYTSDPRSRVVANKERWYSHANWSSLLAIALHTIFSKFHLLFKCNLTESSSLSQQRWLGWPLWSSSSMTVVKLVQSW